MAFDPAVALKHRLLLIEGDFASERLRALDAVLQAAGLAEADAFDRETIVASDKPFSEWVASSQTVPFLADRRCVIVRNVDRVDPAEAAESLSLDTLSQLPESALLILVADDETGAKSDARSERMSPWRKVVQKAKGHVASFAVKGASDRNLTDLAKAAGKKLPPRTANLLMEMVAGRQDRAEEELAKLVLYVGEAHEITAEDLKRSVTPELEHSIFQLMDASWAGDARTSLEQLHRLRDQTPNFNNVAHSLLAFMGGQIRTMWQARGAIENSLEGWEPQERGLSKTHEFPRRKAVQRARTLDYRTILACQKALRKANAQVTAGSFGVDNYEVIEQMILSFCQITGRRRPA